MLKPRIQISWKDLGARAVELVLEAERTGAPGVQKRRQVIRALSKDLDEAISWGDGPVARVLELVDGLAIQLVALALVEGALAGVESARKQ